MTDFKLLQAYGRLGDLNREIIEYLYTNGEYRGHIVQFTKDLGKTYSNAAANVRKALGNLETMKIVIIHRNTSQLGFVDASASNGVRVRGLKLNDSWEQELVKRFDEGQILNNYMKYTPRSK